MGVKKYGPFVFTSVPAGHSPRPWVPDRPMADGSGRPPRHHHLQMPFRAVAGPSSLVQSWVKSNIIPFIKGWLGHTCEEMSLYPFEELRSYATVRSEAVELPFS